MGHSIPGGYVSDLRLLFASTCCPHVSILKGTNAAWKVNWTGLGRVAYPGASYRAAIRTKPEQTKNGVQRPFHTPKRFMFPVHETEGSRWRFTLAFGSGHVEDHGSFRPCLALPTHEMCGS
jgi:hypothetical protein